MTIDIVSKLRGRASGVSRRQEDSPMPRWPYASVQLSCSLRLHPSGPDSEVKQNKLGPGKKDFQRIESDLKHLVARCNGAFSLRGLYNSNVPEARVTHTLLPGLSRHRVIDVLPKYFNSKDAPDFPSALDRPGRSPEDSTWRALLRVQIARGARAEDLNAVDTNDWLIEAEATHKNDGLSTLRDFYAFLFAQRREATFASNVSDRAYNVWLPPTLLVPMDDGYMASVKGSALAVLPFVSLLRLPNQSSWRPTLNLSVLFIPVRVHSAIDSWDGRLEARSLDNSTEVKAITSSLQGSTSHAPRLAQQSYQCINDSDLLWRYLEKVATGRCTRSLCKCPRWSDSRMQQPKTIRQYIEGILLAMAASAPQTLEGRRRHGKILESQRVAASEVARSARLTSIWSVQLLSQQEIAWREGNGRYQPYGFIEEPGGPVITAGSQTDPDSGIALLPPEVQSVIKELANPGHLPTEAERIDDLHTLETRGGMSWKMPRSRGLLFIQSIQDDHFPDASVHKTFAWIGVMVVAAVAIREMTQALLHETLQAKDSQDLARVDRGLLVELEELYDVDIVGSVFTHFYRNLRKHLGLDADYARVREQVQSLSAATGRESNIRSHTWDRAIAATAAAFGAALLLLGMFTYAQQVPHARQSEIWWAVAILGSVFFITAFFAVSRGKERLNKGLVWVLSIVVLLAVACFIWAAVYYAGAARLP